MYTLPGVPVAGNGSRHGVGLDLAAPPVRHLNP
jgi:hypothetical protein